MGPGEGIDIRSYKRNRSVVIIRVSEMRFKVIERGFFVEEFEVEERGLEKLLKKVIKREFPRSHKLRLYHISGEELLPYKRL